MPGTVRLPICSVSHANVYTAVWYTAFKQIDKIHLPHHNHTLPVFIHAVDEFVIIAVVNVQPLIAGDDAYLGQRLRREIEQRLGNGHIDMYRSFP